MEALRELKLYKSHGDRTFCHRGHLFDEANTEWAQGRRRCRTCQKARRLAYYYRSKEGR